jgi:hypothetical protein
MHSFFIQYIFLILIILGLVMLANRLRVAYPIVLVLGGLALSSPSTRSRFSLSSFHRSSTKPHGKRRGKSFGNGGV